MSERTNEIDREAKAHGHTASMYVSEESPEQGWKTVRGERGGKAADQGEHFPFGTHPTPSGTARVPRVGECADKYYAWPLFIRDKSRMR